MSGQRGNTILIVEDFPDDVTALQEVLQQAGIQNPVRVVHTAMDAIAYLGGSVPYTDRSRYPVPGIIMLDLKLPGMDGFEFLDWLRGFPELDDTLVIAISGLDNLSSIRRAYALGADSFLTKPCRTLDLENLIQWFPGYWKRGAGTLASAGSSAEEKVQ